MICGKLLLLEVNVRAKGGCYYQCERHWWKFYYQCQAHWYKFYYQCTNRNDHGKTL